MIRTFADAATETFFRSGKSRHLSPSIRTRAAKRLLQLDAAREVGDLRLPPSNHLEKLAGNRKGNGVSVSTSSGGFAFALKMAMLSTSRLLITTEEAEI